MATNNGLWSRFRRLIRLGTSPTEPPVAGEEPPVTDPAQKTVPCRLSLFIGVVVTLVFGGGAFWVACMIVEWLLVALLPETLFATEEIAKKTLGWLLWVKVPIGLFVFWAVIVFIGIGGFRKVLAAHTAVLIVLEYRFKNLRFNEGPHWVLPFISELRLFSTQNIPLPFAEGEKYVEMPSEDLATMKVRGSVQYRIVDPYLASGVEDIPTTLRGHALSRLRNAVSKKGALILPGIKPEISATVHNGDAEDPINDPTVTSSLEIDAAKLGAKIIAVIISDMDPPQELVDAKQRAIREQVEKEYKQLESGGFAERVLAFMGSFPNLSVQEAILAVELQDGDKKASRVTIGSGGPSSGSGSSNVAPVVVINPGNNN